MFFLHEDHIFSWVRKIENNIDANDQRLKFVSKTESALFYPDSDMKFFFIEDINDEQGKFIAQEIKMIEVQFSGYKTVTVLRDDDPNTSLQALSVDQSNDYLILVFKTDT